MKSRYLPTFALALTLGLAAPALAQQEEMTGDIGAQVTVLRLGEFDTTSVGGGVQASWNLTPRFAIDALISAFPAGDASTGALVDDQRKILGLVGIRAGQQFDRVEVYARLRPGFLNFNQAERDAVACILIDPPPLSCRIADGYTALAAEVGAGVRVRLDTGNRLLVNLDVGDLMVRYAPDGEFRRNGDINDVRDSLLSHNLIVNAGLSWRF